VFCWWMLGCVVSRRGNSTWRQQTE
jgi:hypothetical protein